MITHLGLRIQSYKDVFRIFCFIILCFSNVNAGKRCDSIEHFTCDNGRCISESLECDGNNDCGDNSDEKCDKSLVNGFCDDGFVCNDSMCIPKEWKCDGTPDCSDKSDEPPSCLNSQNCDGFICNTGFNKCIPSEWRCDGTPDCLDKSDEVNCSVTTYNSTNCNIWNHQYLCNDTKGCLDLADVCNAKPDCLDGSDEGDFCRDSCAKVQCNAGKICVPTPRQGMCTCQKGFMPNFEGICADIDECSTFGICSQRCTNYIGSYACSCIEGYFLSTDNKTCLSKGGEGLLTFSLESEVRALFLDSRVYYPVVTNLSSASGVAYDGIHIYWTQVADGKESINRANEDGSSISTLVNFGLGIPENMAIDLISGNFYFTDSLYKHIGVCDASGNHCSILHTDGVDNPRGIVLDSKRGWMYWTDWGENHFIAKSAMDGSQRSVFISEDIYWPNGIAIDHGTDRLYWADAKKKRIECIKLNGSDRRIIVTESVEQPFSIAVYENSLFWSDWHANQVISCDKFSGKHPKVIARKRNSRVYGVHVFNPAVENTHVNNPCNSSVCSHLCLTAPSNTSTKAEELSFTCSCPINFDLEQNGKSCVESIFFDTVFIGISHSLFEFHHKIIGKKKIDEISIDGIRVLGGLTYDYIKDSIIFSDLHRHTISSMDRKTRKLSMLYESNDDYIAEMEFDPIGNNIYCIDVHQNTIKVIGLSKHVKITLIDGFGGDYASDIALAPEFGLMFISIHNSSHSHIDKFSMDGSKRYHFIEKGLIGPKIALTYDSVLERLFWADQGAGHIMSCDIHNPDNHLVVEHLPGPVSICVSYGYVFWVNFGSDKIYWKNIYSSDSHTAITSLGKSGIDQLKLISVRYHDHHNSTICEDNGGCSHACLLTPHGSSCSCPTGKHLDSSGKRCTLEKVCGENEFRCASLKCISSSEVCNGFYDCENGEDESDCHQFHKKCLESQFECHDKSYCVNKIHVCDAIEDCLDGSDEKNCDKPEVGRACKEGVEFHCITGQCIPMAFRCDGRLDCQDHSDENNCKENTCSAGEHFKCISGACIPASWECDGELDCPDASDEHKNCKKVPECSADHITCVNHKCVDKKLGCNGWDDCGDNSDEINCPPNRFTAAPILNSTVRERTSVVMCDQFSFTCSGHFGACLPTSARCNGTAECNNREDENSCGECLYHEFECEHIKECIPEAYLCDGIPDCVDKSDESAEKCRGTISTETVIPEEVPCSGFTCKGYQKCIPLSRVCDNIFDCEDKSDEAGLCGNTCEFAGCAGPCQETPVGAVCTCAPGFTLNADGRNCDDINECLNSKTCSHFCENAIGSFRCSCHEPYYQLRDDRRRCKAKGPEMEYIYLVGNELRSTTESLSRVNVLYRFEDNIKLNSFTFCYSANLLYWMSMDGRIGALDLNTHNAITLDMNLVKPKKIAVDWITNNVFIIENINTIKVCNFTAHICSVIIITDSDTEISSLAVDPVEGLLFWSERITHMNGLVKSTIKKASLVGRNVNLLVGNDLEDVTDISLNVIKKELYWSDALLKQIGKCSYSGGKIEILFMMLDSPMNIDLFEDVVYLNFKRSKSMIDSAVSKFGTIKKCGIRDIAYGDCKYVRLLPSGSTEDVKMFFIKHPSKQISGTNFCELSNCFGICVNSKDKPLCICGGEISSLNQQGCSETHLDSDSKDEESSSNHILLIFLAIFFVALIITALIIGYMKDLISIENFKLSQLKDISIHFNNPGYELGSPVLVKEKMNMHDSLKPGSHHYENPVIFREFECGPENS